MKYLILFIQLTIVTLSHANAAIGTLQPTEQFSESGIVAYSIHINIPEHASSDFEFLFFNKMPNANKMAEQAQMALIFHHDIGIYLKTQNRVIYVGEYIAGEYLAFIVVNNEYKTASVYNKDKYSEALPLNNVDTLVWQYTRVLAPQVSR